MTKHGLFLTIPQLDLLREVIIDCNDFYLEPDEVAAIGTITQTLDALLIEVKNPNRGTIPIFPHSNQSNASGYHRITTKSKVSTFDDG